MIYRYTIYRVTRNTTINCEHGIGQFTTAQSLTNYLNKSSFRVIGIFWGSRKIHRKQLIDWAIHRLDEGWRTNGTCATSGTFENFDGTHKNKIILNVIN